MSFAYEKNVEHSDRGEVEVVQAYLKERGLKMTKARRDLLHVIFSNHSHFTADDLFAQCRSRGLRVSKATLYRTIALLIECKVLSEHDFGEESRYYEHIHGHRHHDHLVCVVCKAIIEFRSERIEELQDDAAVELRFVPIRHNLTIFGVCNDCSETPEGQKIINNSTL